MEGDSLTSLRNEILDALRKSVNEFTAEAELDSIERQDANTKNRMNWMVENGRKSLRDLTIFFADKNIILYSGEPIAKYIWISCIFTDEGTVNTACSQLETLEEFWVGKDIIHWDTRPENIYCMFAKSDHIYPRVEGLKDSKRFLNQHLPSPKAICQSAMVALLFLLRNHLSLPAPDLYYLMAESLGHKDFSHHPQLLCGLSEEEDLSLGSISVADAAWHSITSATVLATVFARSSTKIITFPSQLPEYKTTYNYMDIYQPHGSRPAAKSSCTIWGSWKDEKTWRSVASFSNRQVAELHRKCLQRGVTSPSELSSLLSSHWINLHRFVYRICINDGRLILRDAAKDIEVLRYSNSAKPSIGSANVCLMFLNHFEYFKRITKALCEEVESYPPQWRCPAPGKMVPPGWIQEVGHECETLLDEILIVTRDAREVRALILEQHNLLQSRKATLLTILASIFIPMSFVASIFGMNTREINGSAWQLKYYFIAAIPLAVLTVLLPLIILPAFNFVSRHLVAHSVFREILRWSLIITTLVLNLYLDIMAFIDDTTLSFALISVWLQMLVSLYSATFLLGVLLKFRNRRISEPQRRHLLPFLREEKWRLLFFILAIVCYVTSLETYSFIELPPYLIYFFRVWYRNRKQKSIKGKES